MQAKEICRLARTEAKGLGFEQFSGMYLNIVLDDLKRKRNLKLNRVTQPITLLAGVIGPFPLEADYLRSYDFFYPLPGTGGSFASSDIQKLTLVTMEWFDMLFQSPSISNYPVYYATDTSTQKQVWSGGTQGSGTMTSAGEVFVWPQTSGVIVATHRYMKNQPDIVQPETSVLEPWFPDVDYLVQATAARLMGISGDNRRAEYFASAEATLRPYLIMENDEVAAVNEVKLDARHFRSTRGTKPVKTYPF